MDKVSANIFIGTLPPRAGRRRGGTVRASERTVAAATPKGSSSGSL